MVVVRSSSLTHVYKEQGEGGLTAVVPALILWCQPNDLVACLELRSRVKGCVHVL